MAAALKDSPLLEYKVRSPSGSQQPAQLASSPGRGCRSMVAYTGSRQPGGALSVASRSRRFWGASVWLLRLGQLCYWTVRPLIVTRLFGCPGWSTNHGSHDSQEFGEMLASLEALAPFAAGAWTRWPALLARALAENESLSPAAAAAPAVVAPTHPATPPRARARCLTHCRLVPCPALCATERNACFGALPTCARRGHSVLYGADTAPRPAKSHANSHPSSCTDNNAEQLKFSKARDLIKHFVHSLKAKLTNVAALHLDWKQRQELQRLYLWYACHAF